MITQSSIPYISQVLDKPEAIGPQDKESIEGLVNAFPYFIPARYMQAAEKHKDKPFDSFMMADMRLYGANWLLMHGFLKSALGDKVYEPVQETPKVKEPVIETVVAEEEEEDIIIAAEEHAAEPVFTIEQEYDSFVADAGQPEVIVDDRADKFTFEEMPLPAEPLVAAEQEETLILPIYTEDYFLHQGLQVSNDIPPEVDVANRTTDEYKSLMVVMSFGEWLAHFKTKSQRAREEEQDQKALKTMWQKEKLAAAMEEENEEIPENVFEMAVNSIAKEDDLASESLAEIYTMQGKYDIAIDMYKKLSLRNPQKSAYFARKIEAILKEKTT